MNSTTTWTASPVTLGTFSTRLVLSAVQKSDGVTFTGDRALSACGDKFTTLVSVLAEATYTTAQILEAPDAVNCHVNFSACFRSEITHPGSFAPYLGIVRRQDSSTKGTKIGSYKVF